MPLVVRRANASDVDFLWEMLVVAAFWRPDGPRGSVAEVQRAPTLARYVTGWPRPGDLGVISVDGPLPVGAAWLRLMTEDDPGYGFVDAATPERSIGVRPGRRGRGVGSRLLDAVVTAAGERGLTAVSLSVERDNDARRLYDRAGFRRVGEAGGALTMLLQLPGPRTVSPSRGHP